MNYVPKRKLLLGVILFAAWGSATISMVQSSVSGCKRQKLKDIAGLYLTALESHNPSSLPLAQTVKFTENGRELAIGDGLWKSAGTARLVRSAIDTAKCGTHTQAVMEESGRLIIFGVRLKINQEKISEIETFVAREKEFAFNAKRLLDTKDQDWENILPPEQRSSRIAMVAAADDYFNMFVKTPRVHVPFASPCDRWENGTITTVRTSTVSTVPGRPDHDCSPKDLITPRHGPRRFLVDVEAGIVVAYVHFAGNLPDFHMFKMRNGKIELIQAVIGSNSGTMGWPDEPACIQ
jgi:hypothetical protein